MKRKALLLLILAIIVVTLLYLGVMIASGSPEDIENGSVLENIGAAAVINGTEPQAKGTPDTKEPGFETVLAVMGLLAVAFLVLRQRK